jgi:hypothetical protein
MRLTKFLISLSMVILCSLHCGAQDTDYVYADSSVIKADSLLTRALVVDIKKNSRFNENVIVDSSLQKRQLSIINDSAEVLKNARSFAYAKNLDSILKVLQQAQRSQAAPAKVNLSWLERFFFSPVTKVFFWILAGLFIGFILYKLFFTTGIFQRQSTTSNVALIPAEEEHLAATTDYNKLITQAAANKNYRMAIRYHYLQTLQKLALKNAIQFAPEKTNYQYITELSGKPYKDQFVALTINYEYAWYGGFDMNEIIFAKIQNNFKQFNSQL